MDRKTNMEDKILYMYLDFDGVLTTKFSVSSKLHPGLQFDDVCVDNLKAILIELKNLFAEITIVVISDWRYDLSRDQLKYILIEKYGLEQFIDRIEFTDKGNTRENEIKQHLAMIGEADAFVILDDMRYRDGLLIKHLVRTRAEDGIRAYEDVRACIMQILHK
ncbi:HAD domain-containing protein [Lentibacillus cibarius]|uniref:Uncharacterized protein n=1 Tax=Lentibacillus cibarius TaxID=2583219 RepID=A0A5S3QJE7_9BACI|nr:HAD domain-containing protein [Lentibacillus cibarius]TMN21849.1 hypothetical protein FFL34_06770 [Lentibacillus cibarius]